MGRKEEYQYLLRRSKEFYETALMQTERGFLGLAVLSLEQSLQLFLKAKLLENGVDYPRTHSVRRLLELLAEVTSTPLSQRINQLIDKYSLELALLEDAYITSRYVPRDFREDDVLKLKKAVEEVINVVSQSAG
ncbi:MAG: HEPN domain-containing protein [Candidatus Korarchaeota archaeon]|nr:HEPN domain-containing protein [Candidatus Korarchaeota archaeon]